MKSVIAIAAFAATTYAQATIAPASTSTITPLSYISTSTPAIIISNPVTPPISSASASSSGIIVGGDCSVRRMGCEASPNANMATCAAEYAACIAGTTSSVISTSSKPVVTSSVIVGPGTTTCDMLRRQCQTAPDANMAYCAAQYASCMAGGTSTSSTVSKSSSSAVVIGSGTTTCDMLKSKCQSAPDANYAYCAAEYAKCMAGGNAYVTTVVTALTTVCPSPTTLTINSKTYTISKSTTLTITNCPCTISSTVTSLSTSKKPTGTAPYPVSSKVSQSSGTGYLPIVSPTPTKYTGAANKAHMAGGAMLVGALGLMAL